MKQMKTMTAIKNATEEELIKQGGLTARQAESVFLYFHEKA